MGHVFEVTLDGELVWDYINPEGNTGVFPQGTTPQQNSVFTAYRYGTSHPGLEDKVLIAGEPLQSGGGPPCELHTIADSTATQLNALHGQFNVTAFPNPTASHIHLISSTPGTWRVMNGLGQVVPDAHLRVNMSWTAQPGPTACTSVFLRLTRASPRIWPFVGL